MTPLTVETMKNYVYTFRKYIIEGEISNSLKSNKYAWVLKMFLGTCTIFLLSNGEYLPVYVYIDIRKIFSLKNDLQTTIYLIGL